MMSLSGYRMCQKDSEINFFNLLASGIEMLLVLDMHDKTMQTNNKTWQHIYWCDKTDHDGICLVARESSSLFGSYTQ